ncbi:Pentatricopeptide repeat-containing protein [Dichanthelium oligosanthes]|uniref:Pentatricopeptide repeat-containing protein n=1 Tax=Dichanthelium oligosanthes TaxID=888268 RepID=A0A1E5WFI7_9POAL|nr:Pentatricopeptide repeat-containing protein [Dichanthelium oligosanthes]
MRLPRVHLRLSSTAAVRVHPPPFGATSHEVKDKKGWQLELEQHVALGQLASARQVLDRFPAPDARAYNSLIRAYSWRGPFHAAIDLYRSMLHCRVAPNKYTFPFVLKACSALPDLRSGRAVHAHAVAAGLHTDLFVSTALIDLYIRCARFGPAANVFAKMPTRDVVAWNAMLAGYAQHGMYQHAIAHLLDMQAHDCLRPNASTLVSLLPLLAQHEALSQGTSVHAYCLRACLDKKEEQVLVGTALLDMYAKCKHLVYACRVFHGMPVRNEVTWSALIGGFVLCDRMVQAFSLFKDMLAQGGLCFLSSTSVASALRVCASLADVPMGTQLHALLAKSGDVYKRQAACFAC